MEIKTKIQKRKMVYQCALILILFGVFGFAGKSFAATPTISSVTGTIANGEGLKINGLNLMNEDKSNWVSSGGYVNFKTDAYGFEGNSPVDDGYISSGSDVVWPCVYDDAVKLSGSNSLKAHGEGAVSGQAGPASKVYFEHGLGNTSDMWVRFYVRFHLNSGSWPNNYQKVLDLQGNASQVYFDLGPNASTLNSTFDGASHYYNFPSDSSLVDGKWYCVELHWKTTAPYANTAYIDNTLAYNGTPISANAGGQWMLVGMINWADTNNSFSEDVNYDNLAVSTSRIYPSARVEISGDNGSTWVYQPPIDLSDTSITVTASLPMLTALNYKLRVTDNQNNVSSIYNLGSGGDATPPANPSGLSVS